MHRGTFYILTNENNNNLEVWKSTQFNGGMGIDNLGKDAYEYLKRINNLTDFKKMISDFNNKYFEYKNEDLFYKADEKQHPFINKDGEIFYDYTEANNQLDLFYDNHTGIAESNTNYIKNLSKKDIEIICSNGVYILPPKEIMITNYDKCINNVRRNYGKELDESIDIKSLHTTEYIETKEEQKIIENIIKTFDKFSFKTSLTICDGVKYGFEIEKWTNGGVDMIETIQFDDFRDSYNIEKIEEQLKELVDNFDIDDEIDTHRQGIDYKNAFTILESLKDFTEYKQDLEELSTYFKDKYIRICKESEKEITTDNYDIVDEITDY